MYNPLTNFLDNPIFKIIGEIADKAEVETYVIGGFVRDHFMKRSCTDIDIVVLGSGIDIAKELAETLNVPVSQFKNFGTAMLKYKDMEIEFVGARKESYRISSRKPIVEDGTLENDQDRRDFTINAMAFSLNKNNFGELLDPFGGMSDINNGIIRTPLDADTTFSDDPLRMIRAIRFASQLGFRIEEKTFEAIERNKERIKIVSKERITSELEKIIMSPTPSVGFKLFDKSNLLSFVFPELEKLKGVEKREGKAHKDNFIHTLQVLDNISEYSDNLWLRWAALLHDIAKPQTKSWCENIGWSFHGHEVLGSKMVPGIFKKMKMPLNEKMKYVQKMVFLHLRPIALSEDVVTDSAVRRLLFEAGDDIDDLMTLCQADITSTNEYKVNRFMQNFELVKEKLKIIEVKDRIRNFQPPITGQIIMETYNIPPSNTIGEIKARIKDAILDGVIENDYQQAYDLMEKIAEETYGLKKSPLNSF